MRYVLLALVSLSHIVAARGFWNSITHKRIPNMVDFACVSILLYYDVGIWLDFSGLDISDRYLGALAAAGDVTFYTSALILLFMPWLFHVGARLANRGYSLDPVEPVVQHSNPRRRMLFTASAVCITVPLAVIGYIRIAEGLPIWDARLKVANEWGSLITILYLPIHLLAFYVCQSSSRSRKGMIFVSWLVASGVISTLTIGQRTNTLLPFVILALFWFRLKPRTLVAGVALLIVGAATFLPFFKERYAGSGVSPSLVVITMHNDFARSGTLATAVDLSPPLGTRILPYPLAGYVYSALFFVPRSIAPFKGESTALYFTGHVSASDPFDIDWGFGIGVAEELLLNVGIAFVAPGFLLYGIAIGFIDRYSRHVQALVVPTRLGCLWLCGYNLPSILLMFGTMAVAVWICDRLFIPPRPSRMTGQEAMLEEYLTAVKVNWTSDLWCG
jgi:hypothetical protein